MRIYRLVTTTSMYDRDLSRAVVIVVSHVSSCVYVYKGWKKTRTRAHNANVARLLQVMAEISRSHFPCAFTFPQVSRAYSVRFSVRLFLLGGERGVMEGLKSSVEPIR